MAMICRILCLLINVTTVTYLPAFYMHNQCIVNTTQLHLLDGKCLPTFETRDIHRNRIFCLVNSTLY